MCFCVYLYILYRKQTNYNKWCSSHVKLKYNSSETNAVEFSLVFMLYSMYCLLFYPPLQPTLPSPSLLPPPPSSSSSSLLSSSVRGALFRVVLLSFLLWFFVLRNSRFQFQWKLYYTIHKFQSFFTNLSTVFSSFFVDDSQCVNAHWYSHCTDLIWSIFPYTN